MSGRPAETGGVAAAVALLVAHLFGVSDATTITALAVVVGCVPAAITWVVVLFERGRSSGGPAEKGAGVGTGGASGGRTG